MWFPKQSRSGMLTSRDAPTGVRRLAQVLNGAVKSEGIEAAAQGGPGFTARFTGEPARCWPPIITLT
jgi:hypothetical protein